MGFGPLVAGSWLAEHLGEPALRVIDLRWYLDGRSGRQAYEAAHIPGAAFVDLEAELTGRAGGAGRHPLPERARFQAAMRRAGVRAGDRVAVYDDQGGFSAGRLWWLLRYFGHERAAVLDGGLGAWPGRLEAGATAPEPGDFVAGPPRTEMKLDYEELRRAGASAVVLDARTGERYRGEAEPIDPRAGHIPGAANAPWPDNLDRRQRFRSSAWLRGRYRALGVSGHAPVVVYCGSGVSACHDLLALEVAGLGGARLYPGSWSDWSRRPGAAVATGEERSRKGLSEG